MAELSSLLFVDTDELGRPTGLIASEENDTFASALMPQDVKDTVDVVKEADVSGSYEGWNTVSGVSALADVSGELLALPTDFTNLEGSVGEISSVVNTFDPDTILDVSSTVFNYSGSWEDTRSTVINTSGIYVGVDSGLSALQASAADISAAVEVLDPDTIEGISSTVFDNSSNWESTYSNWENTSSNLLAGARVARDTSSDLRSVSATFSNASGNYENTVVVGTWLWLGWRLCI